MAKAAVKDAEAPEASVQDGNANGAGTDATDMGTDTGDAGTGAEGHAPTTRFYASYLDTSTVDQFQFVNEADLPADAMGAGSGGEARKYQYHKLLSAVKAACEANPDNIGKFIKIAKFATNQGANTVKKGLNDGTRPKPDGEFAVKCTKFKREDGNGNGSELWVAYMGS